MAEILKEWLTERLQRQIVWNAEEFGNMMKNGHVIASVLLSYNVINEEKLFLIRSSNATQDIENNWKYLQEWLRQININLSATDVVNVMDGKGTALLRLFYQLFLHLDKMDRIDFIKRERKMVSNLVKKMGTRFTVDKIDEKEEPEVDYLSKPLLNEKHFIEWQRKKSEEVKETFDYIRHKYVKTLETIREKKTPCYYNTEKPKKPSDKDKVDMEVFSKKFPCETKNYTYEELLEMENKAAEERKAFIDSEWAQNYMDNLYTRMHNKSDSEEFQKQISNALSSSMWNMSINEEETKLDTELAKKVLKLSQFEKQMCTQIMETKQQARNMFQNRVQAEKEFEEQRRHQFDQFFDMIKDQIQSGLAEIDFEKSRQNVLHKRLYAEKMRRKRQHYYEICYETILSIVDYATRYAYFKKLIGEDIPEHYIHEWKMLYFKKQPIFEIFEPTEDLLKEPDLEEEELPEVEEIIRLELDRQEAMNDGEFLEYHNYTGPWSLDRLVPNFDPESEERKFEYLGTRVLGHVVYTLLEIKYPYPPPRPPADLPQFISKAILRSLPDRAITTAMQTLLNFRGIHVVRLEAAINYCLKQFRTEMIGCTDIELSFDKFLAVAQEEPDKELIRLMKIDDDIANKSAEPLPVIGAPPPNTKQTQTPKTIPEEEIVLSTAAELGQYAYQALSGGEELTNYLLAAMIVEYIKGQDDIKGFVIINYPNSYQEAQILEEAFSGQAPPDEANLTDKDDIYLEEAIANHRKIEKDEYKEIRISRLVNDPHKRDVDKPFESYFSCYIQLKETEDILEELVIWDLTEDNSEFIDRFYSILGINYSMYYEVIEKDFLAQICKYIIGECLTSVTSYSDILFGENVLSNLNFPSAIDKRTKSKILKPETAGGISKDRLAERSGLSQSKQSLLPQSGLNVVKNVSSEEMFAEDTLITVETEAAGDAKSGNDEIVEEVNLLAGEEDWDYGKIPIPPNIGVALATCWEEVEKVYLNDMKKLFFAVRLQINCLALYVRFIKDKMTQIITLPSTKQDLVSQFQKEYNDFESDWRTVGVTRNEWHCRVKELQSKLYHICDERKLFAEQQRQAMIMDNWTMEELTCMVNSYISCMQTELNRSILTFQALHDFYFAELKRLPSPDRLSSKDLTKIYNDPGDDGSSGKKPGGEDKVFRQLKAAFIEMQLKNIEIDYSNNPFNLILENNAKFALKVIKDTNDSYRSIISKEYTELAKQVTGPKKKDETIVVSPPSITSEDIFRANAMKCIDEWTVGINGEMYRASLRILALQYKCYQDMKLFNDMIYKTFMLVQDEIDTYYLNEIESVDRLCKYLQLAVENSRKVPETLILEHDTFVIDPNLLQFPPTMPRPEPPVDDYVTDMEFKVAQLDRLRSQFKIVAPTGIALQQAFIYVLQDFVIFGQETCEGSLVPVLWKQLDPEQVPKLVFQIFGDTAYVDWRDFLIHCANIRFPTVEELLDMRHEFRCLDLDSTELIGKEGFNMTELWFERHITNAEDPCAQLRKNLIKQFLFHLYETSEDTMNYSAFLLALCKSTDPMEGFASALSVAVGKKVCYSYDECNEVVCHLIQQKKYRDACLACALECTNQLLNKVIANVIDICEGTTLVELPYDPVVEDKKGKKGKGSSSAKIKKGEQQSQSARLSKEKNLNLGAHSKAQVQSAVEVRNTYICPPCQEDEVEEKSQEQAVEEEQKIESPAEDPLVAYAISQKVIWSVLQICLPWHFSLLPEEKVTPYVSEVEEIFKRHEVDTDNGDIYVCRFLKEPVVCKLLHKVKKFTAINLLDEVREIIS